MPSSRLLSAVLLVLLSVAGLLLIGHAARGDTAAAQHAEPNETETDAAATDLAEQEPRAQPEDAVIDSESTAPASADTPLATTQHQAGQAALIGAWRANIGREQVYLRLEADGSFTLNDRAGTFQRYPATLVLHFQSVEDAPAHTIAYRYAFINRQLELSEGDLEEPILFIRQFNLAIYLAELFNTDVDDIWQRFNRILFIVIVVAASALVIRMVRGLTHMLIFSEWGPFAFFYRNRKNRAKTIHSIVLNLVKYFIYFTALGMILAELGVNYMTYVASLSVIGLAIGFGSQGLVQDMVTGFFIIFEGQFDVGDMVEISGQSGYVTELGLRMTKLRNYHGQIVVIPNRNIAMVGNYARGAQRTYIDVQVNDTDAALRAMPVMNRFGQEILRQYEGVALGPLKVTGPYALETNECFVRLHLSIWPNQLWLINEQVIPRLRETLQREGIEPTSNRIMAYYHAREVVALRRWQERLRWRRRRSTGNDAPPSPPDHLGEGV